MTVEPNRVDTRTRVLTNLRRATTHDRLPRLVVPAPPPEAAAPYDPSSKGVGGGVDISRRVESGRALRQPGGQKAIATSQLPNTFAPNAFHRASADTTARSDVRQQHAATSVKTANSREVNAGAWGTTAPPRCAESASSPAPPAFSTSRSANPDRRETTANADRSLAAQTRRSCVMLRLASLQSAGRAGPVSARQVVIVDEPPLC